MRSKEELEAFVQSLQNEVRETNIKQKQEIESLRKERDFYFQKLLAIEKVS
jgi:hypothetical protein